MKILLIMPWDKSHRRYRNLFSKFTAYAPLTLPTLAGLMPKDEDVQIEACDEMIEDAGRYYHKEYDLVLLSFITPSSLRAYEIAAHFRGKGIYVAAGGYHPTFLPAEVEQHVDTVIIGEGEISVPLFMEEFRQGAPRKRYYFPEVKAEDRKTPDRSVLKKHKYSGVPTIIASKGCPNNCAFCAINQMSNQVPRCIGDVIAEIKGLKKKQFIFFDPNFFGNRSYALALMRELEGLKINWIGAAVISSAFDRELMEAARRSGCLGLLVGLESMNRQSLAAVGKTFVDPGRTREAVGIMQSYGISVNGCFVLGFDGDTEVELLSLPEQAAYLKLNLVRYSVLTPTPDSGLFQQLQSEGRILTTDWSRYTQNEVVFRPKNMTPERLGEIYRYVWEESFRMKHIVKRTMGMENQRFYEKILIFLINVGFKFVGKDEYQSQEGKRWAKR